MAWQMVMMRASKYRCCAALYTALLYAFLIFPQNALAGDARLEAAQNRLITLGLFAWTSGWQVESKDASSAPCIPERSDTSSTGKLDAPTAKILLDVNVNVKICTRQQAHYYRPNLNPISVRHLILKVLLRSIAAELNYPTDTTFFSYSHHQRRRPSCAPALSSSPPSAISYQASPTDRIPA